MRMLAALTLVLIGLCSTPVETRSEGADSCKQCADQQRACRANYSATVCKTEYDICMKGCKRK
jgi:hypothetical protein